MAATSSRNAWAVGYYNTRRADQTQTLVEHWNGKVWKAQPSPNPRVFQQQTSQFSGVSATSARNAWAVGYYQGRTGYNTQTLVEHWNGKVWKVQASPNPRGSRNFNQLLGVAATSSSNAWAVGTHVDGPADQTLIEHWNGKVWKAQPSPNPSGSSNNNDLFGVAATSSTNVWAVGAYYNGGAAVQTLALHCG